MITIGDVRKKVDAAAAAIAKACKEVHIKYQYFETFRDIARREITLLVNWMENQIEKEKESTAVTYQIKVKQSMIQNAKTENSNQGGIKFTQTAQEIRVVCDEIAAFLVGKNEAYGDSALNPVQIFSRCDPEELINIRMDDKINRLINNRGLPDPHGEDPIKDLVGYWILREVCRRRKVPTYSSSGNIAPPTIPDHLEAMRMGD